MKVSSTNGYAQSDIRFKPGILLAVGVYVSDVCIAIWYRYGNSASSISFLNGDISVAIVKPPQSVYRCYYNI